MSTCKLLFRRINLFSYMVEPQNTIVAKAPKKRIALIFGYSGSKYQGLQQNPNAYTVEDALWKGLCSAQCISTVNQDSLKKVGWMRCARTDKGVHALRQTVSFKSIIIENESETVARINQCLPDDIKAFKMIRVGQSFNPKTHCDSRVYSYLLPTYVLGSRWNKLDDVENTIQSNESNFKKEEMKDALLQILSPNDSQKDKQPRVCHNDHVADRSSSDENEPDINDIECVEGLNNNSFRSQNSIDARAVEIAKQRSNYRISEKGIEKLEQVITCFKGSHVFHNYTINKSPTESSARRFIISCGLERFSDGGYCKLYHGIEYVKVHIHGQSFMLHQIRKMMASVIFSLRFNVDFIPETLNPSSRLTIPPAPSAGLLLDDIRYDVYNKRMKERESKDIALQQMERDDIASEDCKSAIESFRDELITPGQIRQESDLNVYAQWLANVEESLFLTINA